MASRAGWRGRWAEFRDSRFSAATALVFIFAAAAALFAGSYTFAMANPTPHSLPLAVVGTNEKAKLIDEMERVAGTAFQLHEYSYEQALQAVDEQRVFGIVDLRGNGVRLDVVGAAGASVAQLLAEVGPQAGATYRVPVAVTDLRPLQRGDPRGLALFYVSVAATLVGFLGAIQLNMHASALSPVERIAFTAGYALLGGFAIVAVVDWLLGAIRFPFVEVWGILALTMFTSGMVFTMFNVLLGRWAMVPTWGLLVLLGNPSSGGVVSWPLLPSALGLIGSWLPPGASVNATHTAVYFGGHQHAQPFLVLTAWALVSGVVFWIWRDRHPGRNNSAERN
ncbi:ABC transporter permease [Saccharopolyspora sp. K220]|uniref:ABC transporter permease n=1 Tax=Saccharopolyspora soli TaxID=2926618 RepID=UPI001F5A688B|nr:ABC transporter permease [Saccharopolyspora soli]MCI2423928.1 ABC transporter permease [Saccharopolyspora soli]